MPDAAIESFAVAATPGAEVLFHASPVGVGYSVDRTLLKVNDRLCEMTGYAREELIGQSLRILHPSDAAFEAIGKIIYPQLAEKGMARMDAQLRRKDGRVLDVALSVALVCPDDPAQGVIATVLDVTDYLRTQADLRAARARLEVALEAGNLGLYEVDLVTGEGHVDDRYLSQLGLSRASEMTLAQWSELIHPDDRARMQAVVADGIAGRISELDTEYRMRHADGSWRWILDRWRVYARDADNSRLRVAGVHLDITDRKATEETLAELNRTLEHRVAERTTEVHRQAEQLRGLTIRLTRTEQRERKRLATILHDHIQQLIVAAQIQLKRLTRTTDTAGIQAAAQSVGEVLQEALDASRSLTVELSPPVLYESGLIGGLNWLGTRMREQHGLAVQLHAEAAAEPAGDEVRFLLFECARELLLNIVKHAGVDHAQLTLARRSPVEIRLSVADAGSGFDPDGLKRLRPEEMSFGLFSIQERIAHLGGRMDIESAPGRGTQVTLLVPLAEGPAPPAVVGATTGWRGAKTLHIRRRRQRCRVLIVDDHQIVREGLAGLLRAEPDIDVIGEAANGARAIELAVDLEPDVIVMDVNLGAGIDGIEATRRVLAIDPGVTVIGLSMHIDQDVADAMRDAGAAAYLTKGGPPEALIKAIRAHHGQ
ncbi:MAG: PAS domain-containing protein [Thiohalocapsa sp.]|uniref:PAS domain-containing protein n=1 Tax=Thiohalocapsa sp. TaxID=2497641 RepID=UPI0025D156E0|nr:PAS domain-containing protein [Thiohalocapsa sp.]MCG6942663.1 PAS domain-containing protein [Thiohalocapsa sp.]